MYFLLVGFEVSGLGRLRGMARTPGYSTLAYVVAQQRNASDGALGNVSLSRKLQVP